MQILVSIEPTVDELAGLKNYENFYTRSCCSSSCVTDLIFLVVYMTFWLFNTFIKIKYWLVTLQDKKNPGSVM